MDHWIYASTARTHYYCCTTSHAAILPMNAQQPQTCVELSSCQAIREAMPSLSYPIPYMKAYFRHPRPSTMISSPFSLGTLFLLGLGGLHLVNAQTTIITEFVGVAGTAAAATPSIVPIGVLSDGKIVFTENVATVTAIPGAGVGTGDAIVVEDDNGLEYTAVITAVADGQTGVVTIGESCSFASASGAQAQPTGNCFIREDFTILGKGTAIHAATTVVATRSGFATFTVTSALPTLSDSVFNLKKGGAAKGLRVSTLSAVLIGAAFGAAMILL
ncbi:hypothetical protein C8F01DRAFT_446495 [Mycena amicta]|nr:hypothetical protein C8F01DRAFT_446495 [Mycena amicta]